MASTQAGWMIYNQQMGLLHHGDALWEPAPIYSYKRIKLGDVGYIRRGRFHLLFSAGCPLGSRRLGVDVPDTFEPLDTGPVIYGQPRLPGYLCTSTAKETGASLNTSVSATPFLEPGVSFSFELTERQGAALITNDRTYREDIEDEATFEEYTKCHYNSWAAFARKRHGNDIRPVLVSGVDMTKDFAMIAYSDNRTCLVSKFTVSAPLLPSASASIWGIWDTQGLVHTNCGPQLCTPPPPLSGALEPHHSDAMQIDTTSNGFNQCVFIRYYTMRKRVLIFPKIMKAAAGPHDLGPGSNYDETLPELTMQLSLDSDTELDCSGSSTADPNLELYHQVSSEEKDIFDEIAEYVFRNSEAEAALIHHRNIAQLRMGMFKTEVSEIISERQPHIDVDSTGVGRLVHQGQQPEAFLSSLPDCTTGYQVDPGPVFSRHCGTPLPEDGMDAVYHRDQQIKLLNGTCIPQRHYCQGAPIRDAAMGHTIMFTTVYGDCFPSALALAGQCGLLVDGGGLVFTERDYSINLRIEWPGYDGWTAQIRIVTYQEDSKSITRAKLVKEVAKQLKKFIETMRTTTIDPDYANYKVGPGGIELRNIYIASLEQVSRGSWQPRLIYMEL